jgi:putative ABC transport system permease protein
MIAMHNIVAALLRLFPKRFRDQFGNDMLATFEDRWRERGGVNLAARTVVDLAASVVIEHHHSALKGDNIVTILWQDLRYALRTLLKAPGFAVVAVITLALGIGVNTAMFSVARAVLWRSLPYPHPERLVSAIEVPVKTPDVFYGASYLNFLDWRAQAPSFERLAAILSDKDILREGTEPIPIAGAAVTQSFFDVLGVQPAIGRGFTADEDKKGAPPVVVLSHTMWRKHFAGDPAIIGRSVRFDQAMLKVIGIMPEEFDYPPQSEYWVPLETTINPYFATHRAVYVLTTIGRIRDGKTAASAQAEIAAVAERIRHDYPETNRGLTIRTLRMQELFGRDLKPALLALLGAAGLVLLIACGNLATLLMVRASGRARELAIRAALGAGRRRLIRQLLTECGLLSVFGGAAGVGLAVIATRSLTLLTQDPRLGGIHLDQTMLAFAMTVTIATNLLFGVLPAIRATRIDNVGTMKQSRSGDPRRSRAQQFVVVAEVALCLVLLTGAGLLFESFRRVLDVNPGFRTDHLVTMHVNLPSTYKTMASVTGFYQQSTDRLSRLPGVTGASAANKLPISGGDAVGDVTIEGRPFIQGQAPASSFRRTLPNYFRLMGIALVRGREFDGEDDLKHPRVTIINESMARGVWPSEDPIGKRIRIGASSSTPWSTIVGIVKDVRQEGLDTAPAYSTYEPLAQNLQLSIVFTIRTAMEPASVIAAARSELQHLEPALLIDQVQTMSDRITASVAPRRLNLVLFGLFAALALVLASVGLYGVVAYAAGQRTQEFGIRMALGAQSNDVLRMVLGQGLRLAIAGIVIGIAASLALARVITTLLFGVRPYDPLTIVSVALLVTAVALAACWMPARRATRIAPTVALRCD